MSPKFKVGDRVVVTTEEWGLDQLGKTGVITRIFTDWGLPIHIKYDEPLGTQVGNTYRFDNLQLIEKAPREKSGFGRFVSGHP